ncbi:MAG: Ig-like domain-containing protein [Verrucomicrobiales bacterium]|nr:Ig-like domain-containing protein [Verrucomicrobiales bacterium]
MKQRILKPLLALLAAAATSASAAPGDNLALTGTASSSGDGFGSAAADPIDGNTDGTYNNGSVWHSAVATAESWWEVDLGSDQPIGSVKVWLRTDCCTDRNSNLEVALLDSGRNEIARFRQEANPFTLTPAVPSFAVNYGPGTLAQYVRVDRTETPNWIHLAEVQVFEAQPPAVTLNVTGLADQTVAENKSITFGPASIAFSTGGPVTDLGLQWQQNGADIPGATGLSLTLDRILLSDNNSIFKLVATSLGSAGEAQFKLTVTPDVELPTIVSAKGSAKLNEVFITFSEAVDQASAEAIGNYSLDGGLSVTAAALVAPNRVMLTSSPQTPGTKYTVTVTGVKDTAASGGNVVAANSKASFSAFKLFLGGIQHDFYQYPLAPAPAPTLTMVKADIEAGLAPTFSTVEPLAEYGANGSNEAGQNYGNRLSGWFTAPETANYVFFVSGDDNIELYLSPDTDPANKVIIAAEPTWNNSRQWLVIDRRPGTEQRSDVYAGTGWATGAPAVISLTQGSMYYFEAVHQEGGGGDSLSLTFKIEGEDDPANGTAPRLSGDNVSIYADPDSLSLQITQQPAALTVDEFGSGSFSVQASSPYPTRYQWERAAAGSDVYAPLPGANASSLTLNNVALNDNGAKFRCQVKTLGLEATTTAAVLTVVADTTAPGLACAVAGGGLSTVFVSFTERVTQASAEVLANYTLDGITVQGAQLGSTGDKVVLTTSPLTPGKLYTLRVSGVKDISSGANTIANNSPASFLAEGASYRDSILVDGPIAYFPFDEEAGSTEAINLGSTGDTVVGTYNPNGTEGGEGPRPPEFVGFGSDNGAPTFNGTDFYVSTGAPLLNGLRAFSLEYWVKPTAFTTTRVGIVGQNDAVEYGFINPTTIQIWTPGGGSLDTPYNFERDTWHHVASIGTGRELQTYFDGVLINRVAANTANYGTSGFNVNIGGGGVFDGTGNFFTGQIDEVAIFDKALTAEQVRNHYLAAKEGPKPVLKIASIAIEGANVVINWVCVGTLEKAENINGPWTAIGDATASPYSTPKPAVSTFYRLRN